MHFHQRSFRLLLTSLFSVTLLSGCQKEQTEQTPNQTPYVLTTSVEQGAFLQWQLSGRIEAQSQTELGFQVAGLLAERLVNPGEQVKAGQVLLKIDPSDLLLKQRAAQANLNATQAELRLAQTEAKRAQDLLARNLLSQQDYDRSQNQVTTLQQRATALQREVELTERQLSYAQLKAPAAGLIESVTVDKGQVVQASQGVIRLSYLGGQDVVVQIPETRLANLPQTAQVRFADQAEFIDVTLRELEPQAHTSAGTWLARYALPAEFAVRPLGQTARLVFGENQSLFKVPLSAVFEQAQGAQVWLYRDGQVERHPVTVKQLTNDFAFIEADFAADSQIVSVGVHLLKPGQTVKARQFKEPSL